MHLCFLRPALLWKEYICFCENLAGSIPRQLRYFSTRIIGAEFGGEGARRRSRNTQHRPNLDPGSSWVY